ncbi:succinylglutamate desuccinylase/aspartoacylase family protein [Brumimicrobium aurantiacum]|uniref:Succinylglutamate desuccinylase n=1 Tax=Brumimicrobium aurantiacum TaxID=1737063 RepID=A0A3E1EWM1_9FLAO|nr:succinylglutamate desuccinylase/aspartoacylase family protein [Brumimicrobium aurantiacum]RFC53918.1 succinylglutamate desuccinylase [Brumimicrobium aurantiacum]
MKKRKPFELLGNSIAPGKTTRLTLEVAKLHTNTPIQIPVIVSHANKTGPTLLLLAGLHGDEINGIETVRQIIKKGWHKPNYGTVICIPVFNIFGFLNLSREFPDGRDLNRVFPGTKNGSLASQFAYIFMKEIAPLTDVIIDFHTGASQRNNFPQTRCDFRDEASRELCDVFAAPFTIDSTVLAKSIRNSVTKLGKQYILYEGGKANRIDKIQVETAVNGTKRVMKHLGMRYFDIEEPEYERYTIRKSKWIRASNSGMLNLNVQNGEYVEKGTILGTISDPYGKFERSVKSPINGFIFNVNEIPLVNKGDALFNIGRHENPNISEHEQ